MITIINIKSINVEQISSFQNNRFKYVRNLIRHICMHVKGSHWPWIKRKMGLEWNSILYTISHEFIEI